MILVEMDSRSWSLVATCTCLLLAGSGCGDDGGDPKQRRVATTPESSAPRGPLDLPRGVPPRSSGAAANPAHVKIIRAWSNALRGGDITAASALWAVPSKVQNATPVIALGSRRAVRLFNSSLTCGSVVTRSAGAERDFTIVTLRLTERPGGDCGSGTGNSARTAIRVQDGKIVEWYRLPDDPDGPGPQPDPSPGGSDETTV